MQGAPKRDVFRRSRLNQHGTSGGGGIAGQLSRIFAPTFTMRRRCEEKSLTEAGKDAGTTKHLPIEKHGE
jgi:hypothetical protein